MKKLLTALVLGLVLGSLNLFGAADDLLLSFSTMGPDTYGDGSVVADGECYALVWTKSGCEFGGFAADGTLISDNDKLVIVAPVAKRGHCPQTLFQISASYAATLDGGTYSLYLLDTRVAKNGSVAPSGTTDGKPKFINGYTGVADGSAVTSTSSTTGNVTLKENAKAGKQCVKTLTAAPKDLTQPRIKAIKIVDGKVMLTVQNLPGHTGIQGAEQLGAFDSSSPAAETDGGAEDVIFFTDMNESGHGFYKAIRTAR